MGVNRVVVIGASAGGIDALRSIVGSLPREFPLPICVVVHISPESPGVLAEILDRAGALPASNARSGEPMQAGHLYVAPPDHHLVVEPGVLRLSRGPTEHRFRPAVDPLFRSAAQAYGAGALGVVLTGNMDDGSAGLLAIKQAGGTTIVQDPSDARFPSMPANALRVVQPDHCLPLSEIPTMLVRLANTKLYSSQLGASESKPAAEADRARAAALADEP